MYPLEKRRAIGCECDQTPSYAWVKKKRNALNTIKQSEGWEKRIKMSNGVNLNKVQKCMFQNITMKLLCTVNIHLK
jgi:hypothetical protein